MIHCNINSETTISCCGPFCKYAWSRKTGVSNKFTDVIISIIQKKNKYKRNAITQKQEGLILDEEKTIIEIIN